MKRQHGVAFEIQLWLCSFYYISCLVVKGEDLHKKFGFLHAGIQKGNTCGVEMAEVLDRKKRNKIFTRTAVPRKSIEPVAHSSGSVTFLTCSRNQPGIWADLNPYRSSASREV